MQAKVSVVVPCYNEEDYVEDMLRSVYGQEWGNIELIVVNDGSSDGTLEILERWKLLMEAKGYEMVILSQENQGLPATVRNGMEKMTGEFFCTIDADDEIEPAYVSTMAGWLQEHPEDDFAVCGYVRVPEDPKGRRLSQTQSHVINHFEVSPPQPPFRMENYLLARSSRVCWIYMARTSYVRRCKIVENYCVEPRYTQEPSIVLPLMAYGGQMKVFPEPLYRYNVFVRGILAQNTTFDKCQQTIEDRSQATRAILRQLPLSQTEILRLLELETLSYFRSSSKNVQRFQQDGGQPSPQAARLLNFLKASFSPSPHISQEEAEEDGFLLCRAASNAILDHRSNPSATRWLEHKKGRVIGYGALGKRAKSLIPSILGSSCRLDLLWDQTAQPGDAVCGRPVETPQLASVTPEDLLLVFPNTSPHLDSILEQLHSHGITNYLKYYDILDGLAFVRYPQFHPPCTFTPQKESERSFLS